MPTKEQDKTASANFREVIGDTGQKVYVLYKGHNYEDSMRLLKEANLSPLSKQEALKLFVNDERLKNALKGRLFYLEDKGIKEEGLYEIDEKGKLTKKEGGSIEKTTRIFSGNKPIALSVLSDEETARFKRRFGLGDYEGFTGLNVSTHKGKIVKTESFDQGAIVGIVKRGKTLKERAEQYIN
jgi:hypothetical protein